MISRQNTFVEHQSIISESDEDSAENTDGVIVNVNYENNNKQTISVDTTTHYTDPHLSDCDELSVDHMDNDINWGSSEMVFNIDTTNMDDDNNDKNFTLMNPAKSLQKDISTSKHGHHGNSTERKLENIWNEEFEENNSMHTSSKENGLEINMMTIE